MFLLRVLQVAAILKSESKDEEVKAEQSINMLKILYLPTYFITQCAIYGTQIYLFSDRPHSGGFLVLVIVICNVLKECMTAALGIFILVFAHRLDSIIGF